MRHIRSHFLTWAISTIISWEVVQNFEVIPVNPRPSHLFIHPAWRTPFFFLPRPPPFVNGLRANINPSLLTIGERLKYMPRLQYMATLSQGVGMSSPLVSKHNVTAFIPTDKAFIQISRDEVVALFANRTLAEKAVRSHVVDHLIDLDSISPGTDFQLTNLAGDELTLYKHNNGQTLAISPFGIARIVGQNIQAFNGIIHVVDTVL